MGVDCGVMPTILQSNLELTLESNVIILFLKNVYAAHLPATLGDLQIVKNVYIIKKELYKAWKQHYQRNKGGRENKPRWLGDIKELLRGGRKEQAVKEGFGEEITQSRNWRKHEKETQLTPPWFCLV